MAAPPKHPPRAASPVTAQRLTGRVVDINEYSVYRDLIVQMPAGDRVYLDFDPEGAVKHPLGTLTVMFNRPGLLRKFSMLRSGCAPVIYLSKVPIRNSIPPVPSALRAVSGPPAKVIEMPDAYWRLRHLPS